MMKKVITSQIHSENKAGNELFRAWIQEKYEFVEKQPPPEPEEPEENPLNV